MKKPIYLVNNNFFKNESEWDEKQAYVLGWILSDGHISKSFNCFSIKLQYSDYSILEKIKSIIGYSGPIRIEKRNCTNLRNCKIQDRACLQISSKEIKESLKQIGFNHEKSKKMKFPLFLREDLIHHFIRGYFDGDGCVSFSYVGNRLLAEMNLIGTKKFCKKLTSFLEKKLNVKFRTGKRFNNDCLTIRLAGNISILKLFNFMYKDASIIFQRKFKKFFRIFNFSRKRKSLLKRDKLGTISDSEKIIIKTLSEAHFSKPRLKKLSTL